MPMFHCTSTPKTILILIAVVSVTLFRVGDLRVVDDRIATNQDGLLENDYYRAGFDVSTGALTNLTVKAGDWQALSGLANVVACEPDRGDFWELYKTLDGGQNLVMTRPLPVPQPGR